MLPKLRGDDYTKIRNSAGGRHGGPPDAPVCHVVPSGALILGVVSVVPLGFPVPSLTDYSFLSDPDY